MRKIAFLLLLATVATPSFARDPDSDREARREKAESERAERAEAREERKAERAQRAEQSEQKKVQAEHGDGNRAVTREERREAAQERRSERQSDGNTPAANIEQRHQTTQAEREARRDERIERRAERLPPPVVSNVPREGTQPPPPVATAGRSSNSHKWNGHWRNDHRYNWHKHRNRHRSLFRLGFYFDPFGWNYRPYSIGWRLWPSYYRSSYWLNDPWMYRLPPAYRRDALDPLL